MSYRITIDGDPFCASNFEDSQILNPKVTLEVNKSGSLVFTMLPGHPYYDKIDFRQSLFDVYLNDELIFEGIPVSESTDFFNRKTVTCEGELTFLNDTIQRQAVYQNQTVQTLLGAYLSVHNAQADADKQFSVGAVTVDGGNGIYRYTNFESTMKEIQDDLVENFGGYFRVRHADGVRYLDYLESSPHSSSQIIRIGKNLVDLSRNLSSLDICTVLIPLGAKTGESVIDGLDQRLTIESVNSGKDYLIGTAQAYYGNVWKTHVWDDVTTAAALKTKGQAYLDDVQWTNLVISATAIDLGLAVDDVERFHVLDMIRVVSEPHGLDRYFLLSKLELDLDHPANTRITLGQDQRLSLSARTAQISGEVQKQQTTLMVNASESARQILDSATDGAIEILFNAQGVAYELRINNSQTPGTASGYWRYNAGGWGFYDVATGTYTTAATMDGTLFANLIKAGILQSENGKFSLNMENGTANLANANITGGSINIETAVETTDKIILRSAKAYIGIAPNGFYVVNTDQAADPYRQTIMFGNAFQLKNTQTGQNLVWIGSIATENGIGFIRLYKNGDTIVYIGSISGTHEGMVQVLNRYKKAAATLACDTNNGSGIVNLRSSTDTLRTQLSVDGLKFFDASGNEIGNYKSNHKVLTGVGNVLSVTAQSYKDTTITFSSAFSSTPFVIVLLNSSSVGYAPALLALSTTSISTTGFTFRAYNGNTSVQSIPYKWIAFTT